MKILPAYDMENVFDAVVDIFDCGLVTMTGKGPEFGCPLFKLQSMVLPSDETTYGGKHTLLFTKHPVTKLLPTIVNVPPPFDGQPVNAFDPKQSESLNDKINGIITHITVTHITFTHITFTNNHIILYYIVNVTWC